VCQFWIRNHSRRNHGGLDQELLTWLASVRRRDSSSIDVCLCVCCVCMLCVYALCVCSVYAVCVRAQCVHALCVCSMRARYMLACMLYARMLLCVVCMHICVCADGASDAVVSRHGAPAQFHRAAARVQGACVCVRVCLSVCCLPACVCRSTGCS